VHAFTALTRSELRLFLREPMLVFFSVIFPTLLVVILGSIPAFRKPIDAFGGDTVISLYVSISVIMLLAMLAVQATPLVLATYRERGILRRIGTTPARPAALLAAQLTVALGAAIVATALVLAVGRVFFGVALPRQAGLFLLGFLSTAAAVFGIGLFIAAVLPGAKAAQATGTLLFFPLMFFAGLWTPREAFPPVLRTIADYTPLGAGERALHEAAAGHAVHVLPLAVLLGYMLVFGVAAAKTFRWE
jgi:ABC-2 type transport system permease protein